MIWLNGRLVVASEARIDPADRGLLLGDGVFETVRARHGRPAHLSRHLARLRGGAAMLGIDVPFDDDRLGAGIAAVLNDHVADAAVRITLTRGPAARGLLPAGDGLPTLLITAAPLPTSPAPARAIFATVTRRNEHSPLSRIKSVNYLDSILARREAAAAQADEAILLNTAGRVAEACAANLFIVTDGRVVTPPVEEGALPGIARALLLEAGLANERPLSPRDVRGARAAFATSSLGARVLSQVDGLHLGPPDAALMQAVDAALA